MRRLILAFTVALAVAAAVPTSAGAYHLGGKKWPTRTITYHSTAKQYKTAVRQAVRLWNHSGARIRFKAVSRRRAKLHIVYGGSDGPSGRATLGWTPVLTFRTIDGAPVEGAENLPCGAHLGGSVVRCHKQGPMVFLDRVTKSQRRDPFYQRQMLWVVVHELGHSLGLKHNHPACSVMSYRRETTCPQRGVPWQYRCRMIERDDIKGVIRRYGGKAKPLAGEFCPAYAPPAAPTGLTATYDDSGDWVVARWTNGASADATGAAASIAKGRCNPWDLDSPVQWTAPGAPIETVLVPEQGPGRYCVSAWSDNKLDQAGPAISVWVDVAKGAG
jgi:hypothetical protein